MHRAGVVTEMRKKGAPPTAGLWMDMRRIWIRLIAACMALCTVMGTVAGCSEDLPIENETTIEGEHFSVSKEQLNVHRYLIGVQEMSYYYEQLYLYLAFYGSEAEDTIKQLDPFGTFLDYANAGKSPARYIHDHIAEHMPQGHFDKNTYNTVTRCLAYCEGAREEGLYEGYAEDVKPKVEENMASIRTYAEELGLSFDKFLAQYMGKGVTEADVRASLELREIAALHSTQLHETYAEGATEAEMNSYMAAHKEDFFRSYYLVYDLADKVMLEAVKGCGSMEEVRLAIADYYFDRRYDRYYEVLFEVEDAPADEDPTQTRADVYATFLSLSGLSTDEAIFTAEETDGYRKTARQLTENLLQSTIGSGEDASTVSGEIARLGKLNEWETEVADYADPYASSSSLLEQWLFLPGRREGDFTAVAVEETTEVGTSSTVYRLYIAEETMVPNPERTCDAFYVRLTDDAASAVDGLTAFGKAERMYRALEGIKDPAAFETKYRELMAKYMPGISADAREMISRDDLDASAAPLAEWLFGEERFPGDLGIFAPDEDDERGGYFLAFYIERNRETWVELSRDGVGYDKLEDYCELMTERYGIEIRYAEGYEPAEETTK